MGSYRTSFVGDQKQFVSSQKQGFEDLLKTFDRELTALDINWWSFLITFAFIKKDIMESGCFLYRINIIYHKFKACWLVQD